LQRLLWYSFETRYFSPWFDFDLDEDYFTFVNVHIYGKHTRARARPLRANMNTVTTAEFAMVGCNGKFEETNKK